MTVIVAGHLDFEDSVDIAEMLRGARPHIEGALDEEGCIAYSWSQDHLTAGRVWVYEEWASPETLETHLNAHWYDDMRTYLGGFAMKPPTDPILKYLVSQQEPVYTEAGKATGIFAGS